VLAPFNELADRRLRAELARVAESRGWDGLFLWDRIADPNEPAPSTPISTRTIPPSTLSPATTLVSGLPRQVGTDGNFQVFDVTAPA
jgi:hypothetical protein